MLDNQRDGLGHGFLRTDMEQAAALVGENVADDDHFF